MNTLVAMNPLRSAPVVLLVLAIFGRSETDADGARPRGPTSERAVLGAVVVGDGERRVGAVHDATFDGSTGRVLHLVVEPGAGAARAPRSPVCMGRGEAEWQAEHQRFATAEGARELARRPSVRSVLRCPAPAPGGAAGAEFLRATLGLCVPAPVPAERVWSVRGLAGAELRVAREAYPVLGLAFDADLRAVVAVVVGREGSEVPLPPRALGRGPGGLLYPRMSSAALQRAPAAPGPAVDALGDPAFRAEWEAFWAAPSAAQRE